MCGSADSTRGKYNIISCLLTPDHIVIVLSYSWSRWSDCSCSILLLIRLRCCTPPSPPQEQSMSVSVGYSSLWWGGAWPCLPSVPHHWHSSVCPDQVSLAPADNWWGPGRHSSYGWLVGGGWTHTCYHKPPHQACRVLVSNSATQNTHHLMFELLALLPRRLSRNSFRWIPM